MNDAKKHSEFKEVGKVKDAHALKGELYILIFSGETSWFKKLKKFSLKTATGQRIYEVERVKPHKEGLILKPKGVEDRNQSEALKGLMFSIPEELLVSKKGETIFLNEILNFAVHDKEQKIGVIKGFSTNTAQDLLLVEGSSQYEIPFVEAFIEEIDFEMQIVYMDLPEGLLTLTEDAEKNEN